jgi:integrase
LLCSIYGLRASEIVHLTLDDIDWRTETITVRRAKRGRTQQFPLPYEVGEAIVQYLQKARPHCSCRSLFVTRSTPHRPIRATAFWPIVGKRMKSLGIESAHFGPHALRHACATQLLKKGSSLHDIADFLGHRNTKCVSIYAKYDTRSLRALASFSLAGVI